MKVIVKTHLVNLINVKVSTVLSSHMHDDLRYL